MRDDILDYSKELEKFPNDDDEHRAYFMDMAIKALRLVHVSQQFSLLAGLDYSFSDGSVPLSLTAFGKWVSLWLVIDLH